MKGEIDVNKIGLSREEEVDLSQLEEQMDAEYSERFQPHEYRQVFYPPVSGEGRIDAPVSGRVL